METEQPAANPPVTPPEGEYAIVEVMGHRTIVGRVSEVERFGTRMLAIEPIWLDKLLPAVLTGGASIYMLTPCTPAQAFEKQPRNEWQLPPSIALIAPKPMLLGPDEQLPWVGVDQGGEDREFI